MGELAEARRLHDQELEACRRVLGEEHPSTLTAMNNLANALNDMGELAEARRLREQVLKCAAGCWARNTLPRSPR
ncbi:hypothetical protein ONO23_03992 [Micromonospora noduli]|uniref:tetratricopeptide repeat protein n=1 Tax=Micromonospora noduli TaxID=709876 RepID=UPI000DBFE182|nr:tetratricopeptide repeat protein [Micromonospora noduli]RAO31166.1 hypothetical protein ONO23_03992 [Micromonospora noduli]